MCRKIIACRLQWLLPALLGALLASSAPSAPPDGNTATRDEMIAAKHDFDRYNGEMNTYLDCLNLEMDAAPKDSSKMTPDEKKKVDQEQKILVQKHNAAVDELQAVVGRFNEQLKIFKAKTAK